MRFEFEFEKKKYWWGVGTFQVAEERTTSYTSEKDQIIIVKSRFLALKSSIMEEQIDEQFLYDSKIEEMKK